MGSTRGASPPHPVDVDLARGPPGPGPSGRRYPRVLGRRPGRAPGRTVVISGGIHGNEPAGVEAALRVLAQLPDVLPRGEVVAVAGNLKALAADRRFVGRDLNRGWTPDLPERLRAASRLDPEEEEQRGLLAVIEPLCEAASEPVVFIDLHTTSGPGAPFACMADVLRNRPFAFCLGLPVVLGLEEVIEGSMLGYLCDLGHVGVAVEGGQHEDPASVERLEVALWRVLVEAQVIDPADVPADRGGADRDPTLPEVIEIRYRHVCRDGDGFEMAPGLSSFQPIRKGQTIAHDARGPIRATQGGLLLLPRYQGAGEDGFFVSRPVKRRWLHLSARLRRSGAERLLEGLPGIRPDPARPGTYLVDPRWAARPVIDLFHLFGFRRIRPEGPSLAFSRRRPDTPDD